MPSSSGIYNIPSSSCLSPLSHQYLYSNGSFETPNFLTSFPLDAAIKIFKQVLLAVVFDNRLGIA